MYQKIEKKYKSSQKYSRKIILSRKIKNLDVNTWFIHQIRGAVAHHIYKYVKNSHGDLFNFEFGG